MKEHAGTCIPPGIPRFPGQTAPGLIIVLCLLIALGPEARAENPVPGTLNSPLVVTDMAGRQVRLASPARRIVTTFKPATLAVFCLGLGSRLVGVDNSSHRDRLHRQLFPDIAGVAGVGRKSTGINFETLAHLAPDLVVLYAQKDGLALARRLAQLNIAAVVIKPESFESVRDALAVIAAAAGVEERMSVVDTAMADILNTLDNGLAGLPEGKRYTGYFAAPQGVFSTATGQMLQHEIFLRAGVDNVSAGLTGYFQTISPEQLIRWNPEIIVLSRHMKSGAAAPLAGPAVKRIRAVASGRVYRCPSTLSPWDFPSPLSVLASLWLAKTLYPERFVDLNIQDTADAFHRTLFGRTLTEMGGRLDTPERGTTGAIK